MPRPHAGQLGLLEICGDINPRQWHQRQELRPGLDILPELAGPVAGDTGDRRADHGVVEIVPGQLQDGARLQQLCFLFALLRFEDGELVLLGSERGARLAERGVRLARIRFGRFIFLAAGVIACHQRGIALVVELGAIEIRLGRAQHRRRLVDHRLLQFEAAGIGRDNGLFGRQRGIGLGELGGKVAVVDHEQYLARRDRLVVADFDFLDVAFDLRADQRDVALHIGVVGRLQKAPVGPPIPSAHRSQDEEQRGQHHQQDLAHRPTRLNRSV